MIKIPFSFLPPKVVASLSDYLMGWGDFLNRVFPFLQLDLYRADIKVDAKRYLAMCAVATMFLFLFSTIFLTLLFHEKSYFTGFLVSFFFSFIVFYMQINYPKISAKKKIKKLDSDMLSALRAMTIQLSSGLPIFEAMSIVSRQNFGEVSEELKRAVKSINAGTPQIEALETMALKNPSPYFRKAIWQIINGMKTGAPIDKVINDVIKNMTKEQIIQIERYGSQLNPLAMFYMIAAVIMPALGITFLIVLASFIGLDALMIKVMFWGLLGFVMILQLIFGSAIKNKRPSLLGD